MAKTPTRKPAASKAEPSQQPRPMSKAQLAELVAAWDAARTELEAASDVVTDLQARYEALAEGADKAPLDAELATARERVITAQNSITALTPLPDTLKLPPAEKPVAKPARPAAPSVEKPAGDGLLTITVIGPLKGRRRAGFEFGAAPSTILVTQAQKLLIEGDTSLSVTEGGVSPERAATGGRLVPGDFDFAGRPTIPIKVLGPARGRRRAGFEFGATASTVEVDRGQLEAILGDESLAVTPA